jgi:hypothetical protein
MRMAAYTGSDGSEPKAIACEWLPHCSCRGHNTSSPRTSTMVTCTFFMSQGEMSISLYRKTPLPASFQPSEPVLRQQICPHPHRTLRQPICGCTLFGRDTRDFLSPCSWAAIGREARSVMHTHARTGSLSRALASHDAPWHDWSAQLDLQPLRARAAKCRDSQRHRWLLLHAER